MVRNLFVLAVVSAAALSAPMPAVAQDAQLQQAFQEWDRRQYFLLSTQRCASVEPYLQMGLVQQMARIEDGVLFPVASREVDAAQPGRTPTVDEVRVRLEQGLAARRREMMAQLGTESCNSEQVEALGVQAADFARYGWYETAYLFSRLTGGYCDREGRERVERSSALAETLSGIEERLTETADLRTVVDAIDQQQIAAQCERGVFMDYPVEITTRRFFAAFEEELAGRLSGTPYRMSIPADAAEGAPRAEAYRARTPDAAVADLPGDGPWEAWAAWATCGEGSAAGLTVDFGVGHDGGVYAEMTATGVFPGDPRMRVWNAEGFDIPVEVASERQLTASRPAAVRYRFPDSVLDDLAAAGAEEFTFVFDPFGAQGELSTCRYSLPDLRAAHSWATAAGEFGAPISQ